LSVRSLSTKDFERVSLDEAFKMLGSGPNGLSDAAPVRGSEQ